MNRTTAIVAALILGVLMLIAVGDNPYGYLSGSPYNQHTV